MIKDKVQAVREYLSSQILGQLDLIDGLMLALLSDGHILVEGPPGIAKTRAIKELSKISPDFLLKLLGDLNDDGLNTSKKYFSYCLIFAFLLRVFVCFFY